MKEEEPNKNEFKPLTQEELEAIEKWVKSNEGKMMSLPDWFFNCILDLYGLEEEELELICDKATDEELNIIIKDFDVIQVEAVEIIKRYIPNYNNQKK